MSNRKSRDGDIYLRSRSISEPEISFDKTAVFTNRFKAKHFPFEYIPVDDLHYYRRRKPYLFQSNLSLQCDRNRSEPLLNGRSTEYRRAYFEKPLVGKLPPLKRPPNLKVDAFPFLTGLYKSDTALNRAGYTTEYDVNYHLRPFSPRIGPLKRPPNIKLNPGIMDIISEQKSKFRAYPDEVISRARPPMIKKPNNLHLLGNIELFPEYRSKYIPYSLDSINRSNKIPCYHSKHERRKSKEAQVQVDCERRELLEESQRRRSNMAGEVRQVKEAKILNNNYGVNCMNRYHEKLDSENNNHIPEYRSKYRPVVGERSAIIPQDSHFEKYNDGFNSTSEYNNRYKTYDHFTKSAPIKKQDNLYLRGDTQMRPEYKDRYKEIDFKSYNRQPSIKHEDNLHPNGTFPSQMPEYSEKYRCYDPSSMPERAKGREDYLCLNGDMDYDAEYRNNYVEFPRQRPILRKPPTHIQLSSNDRQERKPDNLQLPINVPPVAEIDSVKNARNLSIESDEVPFEQTPEYRRALRNYMLKERSPTRGPTPEEIMKEKEAEKTAKLNIDPNDVTKILTENKINVPEEKIFDENNEVIVETLKPPSNFKIPTRSPTNLSLGRGASYPLDKDEKFAKHLSVPRKPRKHYDVSFDDETNNNNRERGRLQTVDFVDSDMENNNSNNNNMAAHNRYQQAERVENYQRPPCPKRSPAKYGRRAALPKEDYQIRKKTNVIEGNTSYSREFRPNRHEQRAYHATPSHAIQFAPPPSEPLANNYRPNYEIDKQQSYRESLGNNEPFVVLDKEIANKVKQSSWMKKQWYDTH